MSNASQKNAHYNRRRCWHSRARKNDDQHATGVEELWYRHRDASRRRSAVHVVVDVVVDRDRAHTNVLSKTPFALSLFSGVLQRDPGDGRLEENHEHHRPLKGFIDAASVGSCYWKNGNGEINLPDFCSKKRTGTSFAAQRTFFHNEWLHRASRCVSKQLVMSEKVTEKRMISRVPKELLTVRPGMAALNLLANEDR